MTVLPTLAVDVQDVTPQEQHVQLREACSIALAPHRVFRRGRQLVQITELGVVQDLSLGEFEPLIVERISLKGAKGGSTTQTAVPTTMLRHVYNDRNLVPELRGVVYHPWIDLDGRVVTQNGLDEKTGIYLHWPGLEADPDAVSDGDVERAFRRLLDFEHEAPADRANHAAALLCAARGPALQGNPSPLHLFTAAQAQSGKTTASECLATLVAAHHFRPMNLDPSNRVEARYSFGSAIARRPAVLLFENLATGSKLDGNDLNAFITSSGPIGVRVVGSGSQALVDGTLVLKIANGNQIGTSDEIGRRVLPIRLRHNPRRAGAPHPRGWILANRLHLASCLLRVVRAWHRAGGPPPRTLLPSFEGWSHFVGGPVAFVPGLGDASFDPRTTIPVDPMFRAAHELFTAWPSDGSHPVELSAGAVLELVEALGLDELDVGPGSPHSRRTRIGKLLGSWSERHTPLPGGWTLRRRKRGTRLYVPVREGDVGPAEGDVERSEGPTSPSGEARKHGRAGDVGDVGDLSQVGSGFPRTQQLGSIVPHVPHVPLSPVFTGPNGGGRQRSTSPSEKTRPPIPPDSGALRACQGLFDRGFRVDVEKWAERTTRAHQLLQADRARAEELGDADGVEEASGRLRGLASYRDTVWSMAAADPDNRVRCRWTLEGTGRIRSRKPNVQGVTKSYGLRGAFVPSPGNRFAVLDWSSSHVWVAAGLSGDAGLLTALRDGDPYSEIGSSWSATPERARSLGKTVLLGTLNGAGASRLVEEAKRHGVVIEPGEAVTQREKLLKQFDTLGAFMDRVRATDTWTTPLGRTVTLPPDRPEHARLGWRWQSVEADALRVLLEQIEHAGWEAVMVNQDEVVVEVAEPDVWKAADELAVLGDHALGQVVELPFLTESKGGLASVVDVRTSWDAADTVPRPGGR